MRTEYWRNYIQLNHNITKKKPQQVLIIEQVIKQMKHLVAYI